MRVSTWLQYDFCDFERIWNFSSCEESVKKPAGICCCLVRCWPLSLLPATQVSVGRAGGSGSAGLRLCGAPALRGSGSASRCCAAAARGARGDAHSRGVGVLFYVPRDSEVSAAGELSDPLCVRSWFVAARKQRASQFVSLILPGAA